MSSVGHVPLNVALHRALGFARAIQSCMQMLHALPQFLVKEFNYPYGLPLLDGYQNCICTVIGPGRSTFQRREIPVPSYDWAS